MRAGSFSRRVIDLYGRRIVGHACGSSPTTALVERALGSALLRRRPEAGLVHHSDRGAAPGFNRSSLADIGAVRSLSRPGTPLDNAVIESLFSTLEFELLVRTRYATRVEAQSSLLDYIEIYYNGQRKNLTMGYLSPAAFETRSSTPGWVSTEAT